MKNFHIPLSEQTYDDLKGAARRFKLPATVLAREAIHSWLREHRRKARHDAITAYAIEAAGTRFDLDPDLEAAAVEHLVKSGKAK